MQKITIPPLLTHHLLLFRFSRVETARVAYRAKIGLLMFKNRIASSLNESVTTVVFALASWRVRRSIEYWGHLVTVPVGGLVGGGGRGREGGRTTGTVRIEVGDEVAVRCNASSISTRARRTIRTEGREGGR
jgi:hypothetical protein